MRAGFPGSRRGLEGAIDHTRKAAATALAHTGAHGYTTSRTCCPTCCLSLQRHTRPSPESKKSLFSKKEKTLIPARNRKSQRWKSKRCDDRAPTILRNTDEDEDGNTARLKLKARRERFGTGIQVGFSRGGRKKENLTINTIRFSLSVYNFV